MKMFSCKRDITWLTVSAQSLGRKSRFSCESASPSFLQFFPKEQYWMLFIQRGFSSALIEIYLFILELPLFRHCQKINIFLLKKSYPSVLGFFFFSNFVQIGSQQNSVHMCSSVPRQRGSIAVALLIRTVRIWSLQFNKIPGQLARRCIQPQLHISLE